MHDRIAKHGEPGSGEKSPGNVRAALLPLHPILLALICGSAFALYWYTSEVLVERKIHFAFGADTWFYTELANGNIFARLASDYHLDRILRFHPVTVVLAATWMKVFEPLTALLTPLQVLRGMFALIGAIGIWAAISAFAVFVPRIQAAFWGIAYGASLNIWYFSSIEESKIISATLATIYIAAYLRLRANWTLRGAVTLSAILLVACLNEIVAALLVAVPAVDTLLTRGFNFRALRWIFAHSLVVPFAYAIIQLMVFLLTSPATPHAEGASHLMAFIWYIQQNAATFPVFYAFAVRWIFFSVAAPDTNIYFADYSIGYGGDFDPVLLSYFYKPIPSTIAILALLILAACFWRKPAGERISHLPILLGLAAYALARAILFLIVIPKEYLLYSGSVTLAHLLLLAVPFLQSRIPGKTYTVAAFAMLLLISNGIFLLTVQVW